MFVTWSYINKAVSNTATMPEVLRLTVRAAMVTGPILIVLALLPMVPWNINGKLMSGREAWASGFAPLLIAWLLLVSFAAWGIALRSSRGRWVAVALPVASLVLAVRAASVDVVDVAVSTGMAALMYGYLFHAPAVRRYFAGEAEK